MNRFIPLLKKINVKLNLPQPVKSKIVLEIAADLDDLYRHYISQGLSESEATLKAREKFDVSDKTLSQLIQIHEPPISKFLNRLSNQVKTIWERILLAIFLLLIIVLSGHILIALNFFTHASFFIWPVLATVLITLVFFLVKFYGLYVRKDHNIKKLRNGLTFILLTGGIGLSLGLAGYCIEMYSAGSFTVLPGGGFIAIVCTIHNSNEMLMYIADAFVRSATVGMITLLVTMFNALVWFFLVNKVKKIEQAETEFLLAE